MMTREEIAAVDEDSAYYVSFYSDEVIPGRRGDRGCGFCVRLVTEVK